MEYGTEAEIFIQTFKVVGGIKSDISKHSFVESIGLVVVFIDLRMYSEECLAVIDLVKGYVVHDHARYLSLGNSSFQREGFNTNHIIYG